MTLREKLELAGYRLRSLAPYLSNDRQKEDALRWAWDAIKASCDTHPKGGDAKQAPSPMSGAVPNDSEADAQPPAHIGST